MFTDNLRFINLLISSNLSSSFRRIIIWFLAQEETLWFEKSQQKCSDPCNPHSLQLSRIPYIGPDLCSSLLSPITNDEVKQALFSMNSYKAPGPDGFQPIFFKSYWHIVGEDVWRLVSETFGTDDIDSGLVETMIVPIPKTDAPLSFNDFHPISLCNVLLKIISKLLVMRIRPFLNDFIGPLQSSFIPNRGTSNNAIIAQEIVHHMYKEKKVKRGIFYLKLISRRRTIELIGGFLLLTLAGFGFLATTIQLVMSCITSSALSLKWNGEKLDSFAHKHGLRQLDKGILCRHMFSFCVWRSFHCLYKKRFKLKNGSM